MHFETDLFGPLQKLILEATHFKQSGVGAEFLQVAIDNAFVALKAYEKERKIYMGEDEPERKEKEPSDIADEIEWNRNRFHRIPMSVTNSKR